MSRRTMALLALLLIAGTAFLVWALGGDEDSFDGATTSTSAAVTQTTVQLTGKAKELVDLIDKGATSTVHIRYALGTPTTAATTGASIEIELWRKGDRTRQDTILKTSNQTARTSSFFLPSGNKSCAKQGEDAWKCQDAAATQKPAPTVLLTQLRLQLGGLDITEKAEQIAGKPARCFSMTVREKPVRVCALTDGTPAIIETEQGSLSLVAIDETIPDDVFALPV